MTNSKPSRRNFLGVVGGLAGAASLAPVQGQAAHAQQATHADAEPFYGVHQAGIATPMQDAIYFAAFDLAATNRADVILAFAKLDPCGGAPYRRATGRVWTTGRAIAWPG